MSPPVPASPQDITPDWLTQALATLGRAPPNRVSSLMITESAQWNVAKTYFLSVAYDAPETDLPTAFFLKLRHAPDPLAAIFPGEHCFYSTLETNNLPLPRCYFAREDPQSGATCLILEDLRQTHENSNWPDPPGRAHCRAAVQSLAQVHAHWAQAPHGDLVARERQLADHVMDMLPNFLSQLGGRVSDKRKTLLKNLCPRIPDLKAAHYQTGQPLTRIHGDPHFWNFLSPKEPLSGSAILIDWEDWRIDFAGLDLALMLATQGATDGHAAQEKDMLRLYQQVYNTHAPAKISWTALWEGYRLGHICNAVVPIFQQAAGRDEAIWRAHLDQWFQAFDDMQCHDLL